MQRDPGTAPFFFTPVGQIQGVLAFTPLRFSCHLQLREGSITKVYDLPSDTWFELIEQCSCHPDHFATTHPHDGALSSRPHAILVGDTFYQLHKADLPVQAEPPSQDLCCPSCGLSIGSCVAENTLKFDKFSVIPVGVAQEGGEPRIHLEQVISSELCRRAREDSQYRFVVKHRGSQKPVLLLWLYKIDGFMGCSHLLEGEDAALTREHQVRFFPSWWTLLSD